MTGRTTILSIILAGAVAFGLFHVKYRVQGLEERLEQLNAGIVHEQEQIHVLRAEWAYLNRPQRLEDLNTRYLGLQPVQIRQILRIDDLPLDLPEIAALPPERPDSAGIAARGGRP